MRSVQFLCGVAIVLCATKFGATPVVADDWPTWLGPRMDSVWRESGIVDRFPESGLKVRWRAPVAGGFAGPAVADGRVLVADRVEQPKSADAQPSPANVDAFTRVTSYGVERLLCFRESDGQPLWKYEYPCVYTNAKNYAIGPRAMPQVDGDRVYMLGAEGDLSCVDAATGKLIWHKDYKKEFGLKTPIWGWACHPLIDGDRLITIAGGDGTAVVAYNKMTGEKIWSALSCKEPGYSSPIIYTIGGRRLLLVWLGESFSALNPETGKVYWTLPAPPRFGMAIGVPRLYGDLIYLGATYDFGQMLRVGPSADDVKVLWEADDRIGAGSPMATPMMFDDAYYGDTRSGCYICFDPETGRRHWETYEPSTGGRPATYSNVFTILHDPSGGKSKASARLFLVNEKGDLIIARPSTERYEEIDRCHIIEPTYNVKGRKVVWSHPAFANRSIYYRNDKEVICVSLAAEGEE